MPVLMAKEAISAGESQFTVLVDNTTAVGNLQRLAANQGFDASVEEKDGGLLPVLLKNGSRLLPLRRSRSARPASLCRLRHLCGPGHHWRR